MRNQKTRILLFAVLLTATLGAGLADIFTEVVPIRPYTGVFRLAPIEAIGRATIISELVIASVVIMIIASLLVAIANRTTGIVITHAGGPAVNGNLTGSPGVTSILPLFPLIFGFIGLFLIARRLNTNEGGGI